MVVLWMNGAPSDQLLCQEYGNGRCDWHTVDYFPYLFPLSSGGSTLHQTYLDFYVFHSPAVASP